MKRTTQMVAALALLALTAGSAWAAVKDNYCYDNPAISSNLKPNILLILDTSESMNRGAYADYSGTDCSDDYIFWDCRTDTDVADGYEPSTVYPGYAHPDYWYSVGDSSGQNHQFNLEGDCTGSNQCNPEDPYYIDSRGPDHDDSTEDQGKTWYTGNYLNYILMQRIDMARMVLMGGRGASRQSDDVNFYETEVGEVIEPPAEDNRDGIIGEVEDQARWGVATYGKTRDDDTNLQTVEGAVIDHPITKENLTDVYSEIQNWQADGESAPAEALWSAAGYFAQETEASNMPGNISGEGPEYNDGDYGQLADPLEYDNGQTPKCANNYVLLVTDGMPSAEGKLPDELAGYEEGNLDFDLPCSPDKQDDIDCSDTSTYPKAYGLDNVAYYLRNNDFRDDIEGTQNILTYPVFAFGDNNTAERLMKHTAINGAFEDLRNDNGEKDGLPTYLDGDCDLDSANSEGVNCEEWDSNYDGSPDPYFRAGEGTNLETQLRRAINAILERVSTGSTVATISTQTRSGGVLLQAYYQPQRTVVGPDGGSHNLAWRGHLRTLWTDPKGNIREDSSGDQDLILDDDRILRFDYDTEGRQVEVIYYPDDGQASDSAIAGDSIPDTCEAPADSSYVDKGLNTEVSPVWEAGVHLEQRQPGTTNNTVDSSERQIYYNHGNPDDPSDDSLYHLDDQNTTTDRLAKYWQRDGTFASQLTRFIRGIDNPDGNTEDFRVRQADELTAEYGDGTGEEVWKLGAIITSTPRVLRPGPVSRYPDEGSIGYADYYTSDLIQTRPPMVFVGANDGMLHAFYAGSVEGDSSDGVTATLNTVGDTPAKEAWAFIPQNALPYLRWYGEMDSECNIPSVDYRVQLVDAAIGGDDGAMSSGDWRTLLIGTMGFGGKAIECGDVDGDLDGDSSNETLSSSVFVMDVTEPKNPELLWEQSLDDNTLTLTTPAVVRRGGNDWSVVLGSGPLGPEADPAKESDDQAFVAAPKIFSFDLETGSKEKVLDLTNVDNFIDDNPSGGSVAVGEPLPFDPDQDNLTDAVYFGTYGGPGDSKGRLYRLHLTNDLTLANDTDPWKFSVAAQAGSSIDRPFFAAPGAALDPEGDLWVYAATGRFFSENDQEDLNSQYFFGFVDGCWGDGDGNEEGDAIGGENCSDVATETITVNEDLAKMDDVQVKAEPVSYECRCGSSFFETANDGGSTDCPDNSQLVIKEAQVVEYSGDCPDGFNCPLTDPTVVRDKVKAEGGWYWEFTGGKRVFSQPAVFSGLVNVAGFTPAADLCTPGGTTKSHAVDYRTGTAPPKPVFLSPGGTSEADADGNVEIKSGIELGEGVPPVGQSYAASAGGREGELNTLTQPSTGEIKQLKQQVEKLEDGILYQREQ